ncbi:MAG: hypothetical protein IT449_10555 [Phycisphaerales bacterium]|nr:hypothetical protein [Phycisphaerales bacterium]
MTLRDRYQGNQALALAWIAVVAGGAYAGDEKVLIAPRFQAGVAHYCEWDQATISTRVDAKAEKDATRKFRQIVGILETVESVAPDGQVKIRLTIDRMFHEFEAGTIIQRFDSDVEESGRSEHPMAKLYGPLVGASMHMTVDRDGKIVAFQGLSSVFDDISRKIEKDPSREMLLGKLERLKYTFGDESARVMWGEARLAMYAFKEVNLGDAWQRTMVQPFPTGDLEMRLQCKLSDVEARKDHAVAHVEYEASFSQKPPKPGAPVPANFASNLSGTFRGKARFDSKLGQYVDEKEEGVMQLTVPGDEKGSAVPMRLEQKIKTVTRLLTLEEREEQKQQNRRMAKKGR